MRPIPWRHRSSQRFIQSRQLRFLPSNPCWQISQSQQSPQQPLSQQPSSQQSISQPQATSQPLSRLNSPSPPLQGRQASRQICGRGALFERETWQGSQQSPHPPPKSPDEAQPVASRQQTATNRDKFFIVDPPQDTFAATRVALFQVIFRWSGETPGATASRVQRNSSQNRYRRQNRQNPTKGVFRLACSGIVCYKPRRVSRTSTPLLAFFGRLTALILR